MDQESASVTLSGDPIWEAFNVSYPYFEDLEDTVSTFEEEVPSDVQERFAVVGSLVRHSYFEYDFCDVAAERALFTLEIALKARLSELGYDVGSRENLNSMIQEGAERDLFENGQEAAHSMRHLRNRAAHPDGTRQAGYAALRLTQRLARMVDEMYADRTLRRERKSKRKALQEVLNQVTADGAALDGLSDKEGNPVRLLLHDARALLVDNRDEPTIYNIAACPVFNPIPTETEENETVTPILLQPTDWKEIGDAVRLTMGDGVVEVKPIRKSENQRRYQEKEAEFSNNDMPFAEDLLRFEMGETRRALWMGDPIQHMYVIPVSSQTE